jgi:hypothetical protein
MMAQFCSQCGTPATTGDRFCRSCGETLVDATLDLPQGVAQPAISEMPTYQAPAAAGWQMATAAPPGTGIAADSKPLLQVDVEYPPQLSRGLIFIKWLLVLPHAFVLYLLGAAAGIVVFIAWFAILFTGRFPQAMFDFMVIYLRWSANVAAYVLFMRDEYPPFSTTPGQYPVHLAIDYPPQLSRGLIFIKWLLLIPNFIVLYFVTIAAMVCWVIVWFAILFTGRYPEGLFRFLVGALRWTMRVNAYYYLMTDRYPPFTTAAVPA